MFRFIRHKDVDQNTLENIIRVKSFSWPYPYEKQKQWIDENLGIDDIHVMYFEHEELRAYTNLISIQVNINGNITKAYGIGNVCASEKGKGYGKVIMNEINAFIGDMENVVGVLFCKDELINFYKKTGWILLNKNNVYLNGINDNTINTMISNTPDSNVKLQFDGKLF